MTRRVLIFVAVIVFLSGDGAAKTCYEKPEFGVGLIDQDECLRDAEEMYRNLILVHNFCKHDDRIPFIDSYYDVPRFSTLNTWNPYATYIEFCAAASANTLPMPFPLKEGMLPIFNFTGSAIDWCADRSGYETDYSEACAYMFEEPLDDDCCCRQYSAHVHNQALWLFRDLTCAEVGAFFKRRSIVCGDGVISGRYRYGDVWCLWDETILRKFCGVPDALVRDSISRLQVDTFSDLVCG